MSSVSIPPSKMDTIAAICELAAAMKMSATTVPEDELVEDAVLRLCTSTYDYGIEIHYDIQYSDLEIARELLRLIFMANKKRFQKSVSNNASKSSYTLKDDKRPTKEIYGREDLSTLINLIVCAERANIFVGDSADYPGGFILKATNGTTYHACISGYDLKLANRIFRIVCSAIRF